MLRKSHLWGIAALSLLTACSDPIAEFEVPVPETAVEYEISLSGAPDDDFASDAEEVLSSYRQQEDGAQSLAFLRRRAENDLSVLTKLLQSQGYYESRVRQRVERQADTDLVDVFFEIEPGPKYTLTEHSFMFEGAVGHAPDLVAKSFGSPVGHPALAADILTAEDGAVAWLQRNGYAYARFLGRDAQANPSERTVQVYSHLHLGKRYGFGAVSFEGVTTVEDAYLLSYRTFAEGDKYNAALLKDYQKDLSRTQLFNSVSVDIPDTPPEGDLLPMVVAVEERRPRTSRVGIRLQSDLGPSLETSLTHRNLLGGNETATASLELSTQKQLLGFEIEKPQFLRDGQSLTGDIIFERATQASYSGPSVTFAAGLKREFGATLTGEVQTALEFSEITDSGVTSNASLIGFPTRLYFDTSRNVLDPRKGVRIDLNAAPYVGEFDNADTQFVRTDLQVSTYVAFDEKRRSILALRLRNANVLAESVDRVPAQHRYYAGGGGSVRGYANDGIGPIDADGDPAGGLSAAEASIEYRRRFGDALGAVVFFDGGAVSSDAFKALGAHFSQSVGLGVRYHSLIGPVRADIAFPLDNDRETDTFKLYLAIGQAF